MRLRAVFGAQQAVAGVDRITGLTFGDDLDAVTVGVVKIVLNAGGAVDAGDGIGQIEGERGGAVTGDIATAVALAVVVAEAAIRTHTGPRDRVQPPGLVVAVVM